MSYLVLISIILLFLLLIKIKIHPSVPFATVLFFFFILGLISTEKMLINFVNPSLMTLAILLIISRVIEKSIFKNILSSMVFDKNSLRKSLFKLHFISGGLSAFLNNTAVVASFLGPVKTNPRFNPSKLLIPLSYCAILGGTVTLIGTSTNLIINSFVVKEGLAPLRIFQFSYVGIPLFLIGSIYIIFFLPYLLPEIKIKKPKPSLFFLEAQVLEDSSHVGKTVEENSFRNLESLFLAEIIREGKLISPVSPEEIIEAGDILVFVGEVSKVIDIERFDRIKVFEEKDWNILKKNLVEVVLSHNSSLIGKSIKQVNFRARFDAVAVAVKRGEEKLSGKIGSIRLQPGDSLVLAVGRDFGQKENLENNFYFINRLDTTANLDSKKSWLALGLFLSAIVLSALEIVPLFKALLAVLFIYYTAGFLSLKEIKENLRFDLIVLIGSALGITEVMIQTGAADLISQQILSIFKGTGVYGNMVGVYILTLLMTILITNNAVAAFAFPIAYTTALSLGVNPLPFIMAVAFGSSASFLTPYSYQTNLMIYRPGNYRFSDYIKAGLPLSILYSIVVCMLVPVFFKF